MKNIKITDNIIFYNNSKDIYPLLSNTDLMITDYSGIFFDYLLLNKPLIFFNYDYDEYIKYNRKLSFDYDKITPGIKCENQNQLEQKIIKILVENNDEYIDKRNEILNISFKYKDGNASKRIIKECKVNNILKK